MKHKILRVSVKHEEVIEERLYIEMKNGLMPIMIPTSETHQVKIIKREVIGEIELPENSLKKLIVVMK